MNASSFLKPVASLAFFALFSTAQAADVDITMAANAEGQLEVKLRPAANFDGLVSSLVFTIKWDAATDAHLGTIQQTAPAGTYLPISRSGDEQDNGGNRYQIFVGFGMTPMQWIPTNWVAGQEYTIMTIPVAGTAEFGLVNNAWTGLNNADYYLALGGLDETGTIYGSSSTGIVAGEGSADGLTVMPNPTDRSTVISLTLATAQHLNIDLLNAAGQSVWKEELDHAAGAVRIPLDLSSYDQGMYLLRIRSAGKSLTHRVIKR